VFQNSFEIDLFQPKRNATELFQNCLETVLFQFHLNGADSLACDDNCLSHRKWVVMTSSAQTGRSTVVEFAEVEMTAVRVLTPSCCHSQVINTPQYKTAVTSWHRLYTGWSNKK